MEQTEAPNPYAAPVTAPQVTMPVDGPGFRDGLNLASQNQRFLNFIIDGLVIYVANFGVGIIVGIASAASSGPGGSTDPISSLIAFVISFSIQIGYFVLLEATTGRTLGKLLTSTQVVNADGQPPSLAQIVGRSFARIIPFEALSFLGGKGFPVGWHDSLSGTRVVKSRK